MAEVPLQLITPTLGPTGSTFELRDFDHLRGHFPKSRLLQDGTF